MPSNETMRLSMPLLMPAQAQKHVTVNEALMRLDGLVNMVLESISTRQPPGMVMNGQCWAVPADPDDAWAGQAGKIAIGSNGGWIFVEPSPGMHAFVRDLGQTAIYDSVGWDAGLLTLSTHGAGLRAGIAEAEVSLSAGVAVESAVEIPAHAMVIGAVARVTHAIVGSLSSWQLGTAGAPNRFGHGLGKAAGSWARGMLGTPMTYYQPAKLLLTAEGGEFAGGKVRLAVHWWELRLPS